MRTGGIIGALLTIAGIVLVLGTAGAADMQLITNVELYVRAMASIALMGAGYALLRRT